MKCLDFLPSGVLALCCFLFFQRKTHLCIKFVHSDSFGSLSLQEFTDFFESLCCYYHYCFLYWGNDCNSLPVLFKNCQKSHQKWTGERTQRFWTGQVHIRLHYRLHHRVLEVFAVTVYHSVDLPLKHKFPLGCSESGTTCINPFLFLFKPK